MDGWFYRSQASKQATVSASPSPLMTRGAAPTWSFGPERKRRIEVAMEGEEAWVDGADGRKQEPMRSRNALGPDVADVAVGLVGLELSSPRLPPGK